jgi:hypothetical protein
MSVRGAFAIYVLESPALATYICTFPFVVVAIGAYLAGVRIAAAALGDFGRSDGVSGDSPHSIREYPARHTISVAAICVSHQLFAALFASVVAFAHMDSAPFFFRVAFERVRPSWAYVGVIPFAFLALFSYFHGVRALRNRARNMKTQSRTE